MVADHTVTTKSIDIANNIVHHDSTKHIEIDRHFIKEKLESGIIYLPHVKLASQVADILTKRLPEKTFSSFGIARWVYMIPLPPS